MSNSASQNSHGNSGLGLNMSGMNNNHRNEPALGNAAMGGDIVPGSMARIKVIGVGGGGGNAAEPGGFTPPHDGVVVELLQELLDRRGLARTHLASDHGDGRPGHDAVFQHGIGALVHLGPVDEIGIGQEREGPSAQTKMLCKELRTGHWVSLRSTAEVSSYR